MLLLSFRFSASTADSSTFVMLHWEDRMVISAVLMALEQFCGSCNSTRGCLGQHASQRNTKLSGEYTLRWALLLLLDSTDHASLAVRA
jgi:hypothetical protein